MSAFLEDSFTDTDKTALENHTLDSGGKWVKSNSNGSEVVDLRSNETGLEPAGVSYYAPAPNISVTDGPEYNVVINWDVKTSGANSAGIRFRGNTASDSGFVGYELFWKSSTKKWTLVKWVKEVETVLGEFAETPAAGPLEVVIQVRNGSQKVLIGGVERISASDSAITTAGRIGLRSRTASPTTGLKITKLAATAVNAPTYDKPLHCYLIGGQSNAQGVGASAESPIPGYHQAFVWDNKEQLNPMVDPVDGALTGSAWPAFAKRLFELTGRQVAAVMGGVSIGGSAQTDKAAEGQGSWDVKGLRYGVSLEFFDSMIAALEARGIAVKLGGVLWCQGEQDALKMEGTITKAEYKAALIAMIARYRGKYGSTLPFFIFRTGRPKSSDQPGYEKVRAAQEEVGEEDPYTWVVFRGAVKFPEEGKMNPNPAYEQLHYSQAGYNQMGEEGAEGVVAAEAEGAAGPLKVWNGSDLVSVTAKVATSKSTTATASAVIG